MAGLLQRFGETCLLGISENCNVKNGLVVDHLIPLSSNKLNKQLRSARASRSADGKLSKAPTLSYGSNHPRNLILACQKCNSRKMNGFLDAGTIRRLLA